MDVTAVWVLGVVNGSPHPNSSLRAREATGWEPATMLRMLDLAEAALTMTSLEWRDTNSAEATLDPAKRPQSGRSRFALTP